MDNHRRIHWRPPETFLLAIAVVGVVSGLVYTLLNNNPDLFQRLGSFLVAVGVFFILWNRVAYRDILYGDYKEFERKTQIERLKEIPGSGWIHPSGNIEFDYEKEYEDVFVVVNRRRVLRFLELSEGICVLIGTFIWGYGDLFVMAIHSFLR